MPASQQAANYTCSVCKHVYDPARDGNGKAFEDLPDNWKCPVCGAPKIAFQKSIVNGQALWVHSEKTANLQSMVAASAARTTDRSSLLEIAPNASTEPEPSACKEAFEDFQAQDACSTDNGPDATKACSDTCKPLGCKMIEACPVGSTLTGEDDEGPFTISAAAVQQIVSDLKSQHSQCRC